MHMPSEILNTSIVPAVVGIGAVAERAGLPKRYAPLVSVAAGIALEALASTYTYHTAPVNYANAVLLGINLGASAVGLNVAALTATATTKRAAGAAKRAAVRVIKGHQPTAPAPAEPVTKAE
jgi:hypothetical protein